MREIKTTFKRVALYFLLLAINIIPNANIIPDSFPVRNLSTIYLLILTVCLVLYYSHRVSGEGGIPVMMKSLSWMGLLMILLRGIKYSAFSEVGVLARHIWYLYYVPMLMFPLFLFFISLLVAPRERSRISKKWYWIPVVTVVFIILVFTNDLHQLVFKFNPAFSDWDNDYSHGGMFYVISIWQYVLYLAALIIMVVKCRISSSKKNAWIILIPFAVGISMNILLLINMMPRINGANLIEFPESFIFTAAVVLECCMQLGLIPTNTDYGKLFQKFSISAQITDKKGTPVLDTLVRFSDTDRV